MNARTHVTTNAQAERICSQQRSTRSIFAIFNPSAKPGPVEAMRNEQTLLTPGEPQSSSYVAPQTWDELFEQDARPRVWRKVALAAGLCSLGAVLLSIGLGLWFTGQGGQGASAWGPAGSSAMQCACLLRWRCCLLGGAQRTDYAAVPARMYTLLLLVRSRLSDSPSAAPHRPHPHPPAPAGIALFVLGSLTFLPGFYHTRIAYLAWRGVSGFSFKDIPDL